MDVDDLDDYIHVCLYFPRPSRHLAQILLNIFVAPVMTGWGRKGL